MIYDQQNIFAKILRGEAPAEIIHEDETTLSFMDVMPRADGHALVIPKTPSVNLLDISSGELSNLIVNVQLVAQAALKAFDAEGITIQQFNNPAGGQMVFHTHFHVIPRHEGVSLRRHGGDMEAAEILKENADKYRAVLGAP